MGIIHHRFNVFWQQLDVPVVFLCRLSQWCTSEGWLTSGPAPHCVFKLRRRCYSTPINCRRPVKEVMKSERSLRLPPPNLLPPALSLSVSICISVASDWSTATCSHFTQDEPNHVVREARGLPGQSQQPLRVRVVAHRRAGRSGQDGEEEKLGR